MGFLDDLGKSLNKVGKKTSEMASVAKLKLDITKHKANIDKKYEELGSRIYFLNKEGIDRDESVDNLIIEIDELFEKIRLVEVELKEATEQPEKVEESPIKPTCKECGEALEPGAKFCGSCGAKTGDVEEKKACPNCGAEVGDAKFCNSCGTSIE
jgi:RNA polymerase subunit RPABC4/transcription elongation factor Spt4